MRLGIADLPDIKQLNRHFTIQFRIMAQEDHAHAASPQETSDDIAANGRGVGIHI